jgi:hypothetical protein
VPTARDHPVAGAMLALRVMDPNTFFALLLDRPATTRIEDGKLT